LLGEIKSSTSTIICYRQTIKLINEATGHALHSHNANYAHEGTSGQFQVTAFSGANNDDYWIVKSAHNHPEFYKEKQPVRNGDIIRLEHKNSKRNLHSHYKVAPITKGQQEITTWGENGIHDTNDNWQIEFEDNKDHLWVEGKKIRLIHQGTRAVLHSNSVYSETLFYQDEVTGVSISERGPNDYWHAVMVE
jgi:dolichyl-phosphate-mannose-protein mannosyltransferase